MRTNRAWWEPNPQPHGLETNVSNCHATGVHSWMGISVSPIDDVARIILHFLVCCFYTEGIAGPDIHDFAFDDQRTVGFIHLLSWLLKHL